MYEVGYELKSWSICIIGVSEGWSILKIELRVGYDLFQPKTSTFSTRSLIWVHFKTVRYFLNQFSVYFNIKKMHITI